MIMIRHNTRYYATHRGTVQRRAFNTVHSPFTGASNKTSLQNWFVPSADADTETLLSLPILRDRSRDLIRNAPAATGAQKTMVDGVIGSGLRFQPAIDKDFLNISDEQAIEWQDKTLQEFRLWSENPDCDFMRQLDWGGLQRLAYSEKFSNGDNFALLRTKHRPMMPYDLRIQLVEAARITNKDDLPDNDKMRAGIKYDNNGIPTAVYIRNTTPGTVFLSASNFKPTWEEVPFYGKTGRRNILHIYDKNRIGQSRGFPALAPIIDIVKQLSKFGEAELQAAVINAMLSVFVKRPLEDSLGVKIDYYHDRNNNPVTPPWEDPDNKQMLGNGTWVDFAPGDDPKVVESVRPSAQFDPFFLACIKQIGMAIGIPFEILIKHFSSSYSASRAALLEFFKTIMIERNNFIAQFCQPIYNEWLTEAVLKGRIKAPGFLTDPMIRLSYSGAYFIGEGIPQIDKLKEANAAITLIEGGLSTKQIEAGKLTGMDYRDIIKAQAEEKRLAEEHGLPYLSKSRVLPDDKERIEEEKDE